MKKEFIMYLIGLCLYGYVLDLSVAYVIAGLVFICNLEVG